MWGTASINASIDSYAEAEKTFNNTKPLRGTDTRPLGKRSKNEKITIEKSGEDYVLYCYNTAVVTYKPNGDVRLESGGWSTSTTAAAISALSPFCCWNSSGEIVVSEGQEYAVGKRFIVPRCGLLMRKTESGYIPENPPPAFQSKKRVRKPEAKAARAYFKQVPVYIQTFSAAFEGGVKPQQTHHTDIRRVFESGEPLDDEQAVSLAWKFVGEKWDYSTRGRTIQNAPKPAIARFWKQLYDNLNLIESYEIPLGYGEVAK